MTAAKRWGTRADAPPDLRDVLNDAATLTTAQIAGCAEQAEQMGRPDVARLFWRLVELDRELARAAEAIANARAERAGR